MAEVKVFLPSIDDRNYRNQCDSFHYRRNEIVCAVLHVDGRRSRITALWDGTIFRLRQAALAGNATMYRAGTGGRFSLVCFPWEYRAALPR